MLLIAISSFEALLKEHLQQGLPIVSYLAFIGQLGHLHVQGRHLVSCFIEFAVQFRQLELHGVVLRLDALVVTLQGLVLCPQLFVGREEAAEVILEWKYVESLLIHLLFAYT